MHAAGPATIGATATQDGQTANGNQPGMSGRPSKGWPNGSTWAWRKIRAAVLDRDGRRCQLRLDGCTRVATCVHHLHGRAVTGDDPRHLVASCTPCNLRVGDPQRSGNTARQHSSNVDPAPKQTTLW